VETDAALQAAWAAQPEAATAPVAAQARSLAVPMERPANVNLRVIDAGREPRLRRAWAAPVGAVQRLQVVQQATQSFVFDDESIDGSVPRIAVAVTLRAQPEAGYRATVDRPEIDGNGADGAVVDYTRDLLDGFGGEVGVELGAGGRVVGGEPTLPPGRDGELLALGFVERRLLSLADHLPDEPFGPGAIWETTRSVEVEGFPVTVSSRYAVTSLADGGVTTSVERTVRFVPGDYDGTEILAGSVLSGSGEAVWEKGAMVGAVSLDLEGRIRYRLTYSRYLDQVISYSLDTSSDVDVPQQQAATTTTSTPATSNPAVTSNPATSSAPTEGG
jgi:hypothetical protein